MAESAPTIPVGRSSSDAAAGSRARQRADTRERLFQAAIDEFRRVGFAAAQIDRIAKAAGVVRGTFYFHFPTKDDVLFELRRRNEARMVERAVSLHDAPISLGEVLARVNDIVLDVQSEVEEAGLLRDLLSHYVRMPDADAGEDETAVLTSEIARHIARGQERGELRRDLEPEQLAELCLTSLMGFYTRMESGEELRDACLSMIDVLVKGLRA